MSDHRIAWAITGAGHTLAGCAEYMLAFQNVDIFLSRAAEEVVRMYNLQDLIKRPGLRVYRETLASSPLVMRLFDGKYLALVVAPATSNSVAKFVCGISDTLVTNLFAQAGKSRVPIIVLPTDLAPEMDTVGPNGGAARVYPRPIDLENTARLRAFPGVRVVDTPLEIAQCLEPFLSPEN